MELLRAISRRVREADVLQLAPGKPGGNDDLIALLRTLGRDLQAVSDSVALHYFIQADAQVS